MSKVEIEKSGRVARVHTRVADMLVQRFGYQRRDMQAQSAATLPPVAPAHQSKEAPKSTAKKAAKKAVSTHASDKDASE